MYSMEKIFQVYTNHTVTSQFMYDSANHSQIMYDSANHTVRSCMIQPITHSGHVWFSQSHTQVMYGSANHTVRSDHV